MEKWCKYLRRCPVRDKISVENNVSGSSRRPVGTEYEGYCVPNGTPMFVCASVFYRYHIPNGMQSVCKCIGISLQNRFCKEKICEDPLNPRCHVCRLGAVLRVEIKN